MIIKRLLIWLFLTLIVLINELWIRYEFSQYDRVLRDIDHLIAGIAFPLLLYWLIKNEKPLMAGLTYGVAQFVLEVIQSITKWRFFQFDQFAFDLIGVTIFILVMNIVGNRSTRSKIKSFQGQGMTTFLINKFTRKTSN